MIIKIIDSTGTRSIKLPKGAQVTIIEDPATASQAQEPVRADPNANYLQKLHAEQAVTLFQIFQRLSQTTGISPDVLAEALRHQSLFKNHMILPIAGKAVSDPAEKLNLAHEGIKELLKLLYPEFNIETSLFPHRLIKLHQGKRITNEICMGLGLGIPTSPNLIASSTVKCNAPWHSAFCICRNNEKPHRFYIGIFTIEGKNWWEHERAWPPHLPLPLPPSPQPGAMPPLGSSLPISDPAELATIDFYPPGSENWQVAIPLPGMQEIIQEASSAIENAKSILKEELSKDEQNKIASALGISGDDLTEGIRSLVRHGQAFIPQKGIDEKPKFEKENDLAKEIFPLFVKNIRINDHATHEIKVPEDDDTTLRNTIRVKLLEIARLKIDTELISKKVLYALRFPNMKKVIFVLQDQKDKKQIHVGVIHLPPPLEMQEIFRPKELELPTSKKEQEALKERVKEEELVAV